MITLYYLNTLEVSEVKNLYIQKNERNLYKIAVLTTVLKKKSSFVKKNIGKITNP